MYDGVVFAHGFFDWVTVAPPRGADGRLASSTGGVVAGHRGCLHRRWDLFLLVDMAVFNGFRTDVVHC